MINDTEYNSIDLLLFIRSNFSLFRSHFFNIMLIICLLHSKSIVLSILCLFYVEVFFQRRIAKRRKMWMHSHYISSSKFDSKTMITMKMWERRDKYKTHTHTTTKKPKNNRRKMSEQETARNHIWWAAIIATYFGIIIHSSRISMCANRKQKQQQQKPINWSLSWIFWL